MFLASRLASEDRRDLLEADFAEYYHLDLNDLGAGLAPYHAAVLAAHLPKASRTMQDIYPELTWTQTDYLTALVVDNLLYMRYENARRAGNKKAQKPEPIKRPVARHGNGGTAPKFKTMPREQLLEKLKAPRT